MSDQQRAGNDEWGIWWDEQRVRTEPPPPRPAPAARRTPAEEKGPAATRQRHPGVVALDFGTSASTVALFDSGENLWAALPAAQRAVLGRGLARLLLAGPGPTAPLEARQDWNRLLTELARRSGDDDGRALAARLCAEPPGDEAGLVDGLLLELESLLPTRRESLRRRIVAQLHRGIDDALREPPLSMLRLFRAELDGNSRATELPSVVYPGDEQAILRAAGTAGTDGGRRGIKQRLGMPPSHAAQEDPTADVVELVGAVLRFLIDRTNRYLEAERNNQRFASGQVDRVVITYPTMAPPVVRKTLHRLVKETGVSWVVDDYDEAIAAAMFTLLRDLGGSFEPALEAFQARAQAVGDSGKHWVQHLLIVDVGGGTTDIALLRLDLFDETEDPEAGGIHHGRLFRLLPQVIGTTGQTQRGGEFITLLVFRWIKAQIADHLLSRHGSAFERELEQLDVIFRDATGYAEGSLPQRVLQARAGTAASVFAQVDLIVPTRWRTTGRTIEEAVAARQLFELLWGLAETVKQDLSRTRQDRPLGPDDVSLIMAQLSRSRRPAESTSLPGEGEPRYSGHTVEDWSAGFAATIGYEMFIDLVDPVVGEQVGLARALCESLDPAENDRLDRIVLTGRGAQLPLIRERLAEAMRGVPGWDSLALWQETDFAKHATSIGAAWADSISYRLSRSREQSLIHKGATVLNFDVGELLSFMRGTFFTTAGGGGGRAANIELFRTGQAFSSYADGRPRLRSDGWLGLAEMVDVQRGKGTVRDGANLESESWCYFKLDAYVADHPGLGEDAVAKLLDRLYYQVEATPELDMFILLSDGGQPHHHRGDVESATSEHLKRFLAADDGLQLVLDVVVPGSGDSTEPHVVFDRATMDTYRRLSFADGKAEPCRAWLSKPLPAPGSDGWEFFLHDPQAREQRQPQAVRIPLPRAVRPDSRSRHRPDAEPKYRAVLDDNGLLAVYRGEPDYLLADDLADLLDTPGAVFRTEMPSAVMGYRTADDPFSGLH